MNKWRILGLLFMGSALGFVWAYNGIFSNPDALFLPAIGAVLTFLGIGALIWGIKKELVEKK